jgi:hypothetical protein
LNQVKNVFSAIKKHLDNEEPAAVVTGQSEFENEEMMYSQ